MYAFETPKRRTTDFREGRAPFRTSLAIQNRSAEGLSLIRLDNQSQLPRRQTTSVRS